MPVYIFKRRMVNGACLSMFINGWIFVVQVYYIPTFYQIAYGYSAVRAGALLLPLVLVQTLSSTLSGLIVTWRGRYRESILAGWLLWAAGLGLFSTLDETSGLEKQIGYAILMGFGVGQTLQPSLVAIQAGVPRRDMAVVTGTRNFVRNLGGTVGLAVAGTIINNTLRISLGRLSSDNELIRQILEEPSTTLDGSRGDEAFQAAVLAGYRQGFRIIFLVAASLAAFAFVVVLFLMPELGLDRSNDQELKEEAKRRIQGEKETKAARKRKDDTELASPGNQTEG
ncbi:MAG: hypothetical protein M1837_007224 [Sclerophora amabilis]|nr:MAG: hypothetical protein M1837_007224 [Sclerophora amabilis]